MVRRQSAAGHDAVDVRVSLQGLSPGMQNAEEADLGAEAPGSAATSSSVAALASNKSSKRTFLFCQINGTSACGTLKTR